MKNWFSHLLIVLFFAVGCSKSTYPIDSTVDPANEINGQFSDWDSSKDSLLWCAYSYTAEYISTSRPNIAFRDFHQLSK